MWFDDDPGRGLEDKVLRAAVHYEQKYGRRPDLCFVHPSAFGGNDRVTKAGKVEIRPGRSVLRHHFWLGKTEQEHRSLAARAQDADEPMTQERAQELLMEREECV